MSHKGITSLSIVDYTAKKKCPVGFISKVVGMNIFKEYSRLLFRPQKIDIKKSDNKCDHKWILYVS